MGRPRARYLLRTAAERGSRPRLVAGRAATAVLLASSAAFSQLILQTFIKRRLIELSSEIIEDAYDETTDTFVLLDQAEQKLYEVTQNNLKRTLLPLYSN